MYAFSCLHFKSAGFTPIRGDSFHTTNPITYDIERSLMDSDLVLCDLTDSNPNVFYEMAIAHAICKPVIMVSPSGPATPLRREPHKGHHVRCRCRELGAVSRGWGKGNGYQHGGLCTTSPLTIVGATLNRDVRPSIREVFRLFKATVAAFSIAGSKFRLHFLQYNARGGFSRHECSG